MHKSYVIVCGDLDVVPDLIWCRFDYMYLVLTLYDIIIMVYVISSASDSLWGTYTYLPSLPYESSLAMYVPRLVINVLEELFRNLIMYVFLELPP